MSEQGREITGRYEGIAAPGTRDWRWPQAQGEVPSHYRHINISRRILFHRGWYQAQLRLYMVSSCPARVFDDPAAGFHGVCSDNQRPLRAASLVRSSTESLIIHHQARPTLGVATRSAVQGAAVVVMLGVKVSQF
jgi:hypothetical protein